MNLACLSFAVVLAQGLQDEAYYSGIKEAFDPMYLLARREEVLARYREVLTLEDFAGAHQEAQRCIDRPYQPGKRDF